jgi:hypothetical protein
MPEDKLKVLLQHLADATNLARDLGIDIDMDISDLAKKVLFEFRAPTQRASAVANLSHVLVSMERKSHD